MRPFAIPTGVFLLLTGLAPAPATAATVKAEPSPAVKDAYARGQEHLGGRTAEDLRAALRDFERATTADPSFAPGFAAMAEAHALLYDYPRAREAANRALALDENLAAAHAVLGFVRLHADWDWAGAEAELHRALQLDPQRATPHLWNAILLEVTGHADAALAEARRAVELDPKSAPVHAGLGYRLYWARRYDDAVAELTAALALDPKLETAHYFIGRARVQQGRFDDARAAFARARQLAPKDANLISAGAYLEALAGNREAAEKALPEIEPLAIRGLPFSSQLAGIRTALGDKTAALGWLELAHSGRESALAWLKIDPRFDSLRSEPRFQEILKKMGLAGETPAAPPVTAAASGPTPAGRAGDG